VIGAFGENSRVFDIWVMLAFGVIGFTMERTGFALAPFVIGFVLGPITERSLRAGLTLSDGSYLDIFTHPVAAICLALSAAIFVWSLVSQRRINAKLAEHGDREGE
jgi:putative tricarboxylic transport membrane protein